ncbi:hypothetical protein M501DRAFT_1000124 [Patellaria atrata CBS 101060]|uniref:Uncharacterized protein n=1 Tax=Patellaria atrata CBS 101060 TaxID=1346257 RepID=A0A9P4S205_9PEZI|nr:hypothetical protein M501DRAFT_1000124 [Patellaria atrata CBS 101060]
MSVVIVQQLLMRLCTGTAPSSSKLSKETPPTSLRALIYRSAVMRYLSLTHAPMYLPVQNHPTFRYRDNAF